MIFCVKRNNKLKLYNHDEERDNTDFDCDGCFDDGLVWKQDKGWGSGVRLHPSRFPDGC